MRCSDFGIEASNEYRRDNKLGECGIVYDGDFGVCNKPKLPKAWYQFGQRIVGWSRIAQICVMELVSPYIDAIVNGDTDSIKVVANDTALGDITRSIARMSHAIDNAKYKVCSRVRRCYKDQYDPLDGIGHYVLEFQSDCFCASWNKAYCTFDVDARDGKRHFAFTLAGIPTSKRNDGKSTFLGVNGYADRLIGLGWSYSDVCNLLLGYNVTYAYDVIRMNGRTFPDWCDMFMDRVIDYMGNETRVCEPSALALHPMSKTVNDTGNAENATNMRYARENNEHLNTVDMILTSRGVFDLGELLGYA